MSTLVIPWCTYTDPEVAHVGMYEEDARRLGRRVETITIPLERVDRAIVDEDVTGSCAFTTSADGCWDARSCRRAPAT